jgi:hypothetical protein
VCFNVVRGLLTPTSGLGQMLIHHISVAEFATIVEAVPANTYARRRILETVSPFGGMPAVGNSNMPAGIMNLVVQADPRDADGGIVEDTGTTGATGNVLFIPQKIVTIGFAHKYFIESRLASSQPISIYLRISSAHTTKTPLARIYTG